MRWTKPDDYNGSAWYYVEISSSKFTISHGPINGTSYVIYGIMDPKVAVVYAENKYTIGKRSVPRVFYGKPIKRLRKWYEQNVGKLRFCIFTCLGREKMVLDFNQ